MKSLQNYIKKVFSPDQGKYLLLNLIFTLFLNLYLELMMRKSVHELAVFIRERTFLFLFNGFLIFTTLSFVLLLRKKIFAYAFVVGGWLMVGLANGIILNNRKTPFTAVDLTIAKSTLPIIRNYMSLAQILFGLGMIVFMIGGMVCLFLYSREQKRDFDIRASLFWIILICGLFVLMLKAGTAKGILARKFDNLTDAYRDYGVAYGFFITAVDTGIDRPLNYSKVSVKKLLKKIDKKTLREEETDAPNIVFLQLESFFDPTNMKNLELSADPMPNMRRLQTDYSCGRLKVPVYGAGTINTEFEVLTGMNRDHFGSGEYPFRSILHKKTCDNICYWVKDRGYASTLIHNNSASFYDRDKVYSNLGFDNFISIENMYVTQFTESGWAKDYILEEHILDTLKRTPQKDMIYTISVQGHGDYPTTPMPETAQGSCIRVSDPDLSQKQINAWTHYVNEVREMDDFAGKLTEALADYPEKVILVIYGDHLPGMNIESKDLKAGSKYQTPYVIWDNYGYNRTHKSEESGNTEAWQLASKVLGEAGINNGVLNRYHRTMSGTKKYKKNLRLLEYDMLYGSNFVRRLKGLDDLPPSAITYGIRNPKITGLYQDRMTGDYILCGEHFTKQSVVYADRMKVKSEFLNDTKLLLPQKSAENKKEFKVVQVNANNEKIHYNESDPWTPEKPE